MNYSVIKRNLQIEITSISSLLNDITMEEHDAVFEIAVKELLTSSDKEVKERVKVFFNGFKSPVLYCFKVVGCEDCSILNHEFLRAKTHDKSRKYSKFNEVIKQNDTVLYVGSSKYENLTTRINNHLGVGAKRVYSMHVKAWLPKNAQYKIQIYVYKPDIPKHELAIFNVLEVIEQGFWNYYKPLFGKRSGLL